MNQQGNRPRDSQRSRLYKAENGIGLHEGEGMTIDECQAFISKLLSQKTVQARFPQIKGWRFFPSVRAGKGCYAQPMHREITLASWGRNPLVVIHELTHVIERRGAWHGWEFAESYLWLVRRGMGQEVHDKLKASFKAHKVKFTQPREKRELSPEQREALVERLAVARAAKAAKAMRVAA